MNYETGVVSETPTSLEGDYGIAAEDKPFYRNWKFIAGIIAALIIAAVAYALLTAEETPVGDDNSGAPTVTVIMPGTTTVEGKITAPGTLQARREMPVGVVGEGGRVISVPVDAGAWVRQGQVLAVIDRSVQSQQASSASAQIEVAKADAQLAQNNLDRALQLVERGFISKADVDRLTATRDAARARVQVAQAQYRELLARNARLNIVAPASGLLLERNVEPGQTVSAGSPPLFRIAKGGEMELMARVSEDQIGGLSVGVTAEVVPAGTEKAFSGQVWQLSPVINPQDRQGVARIALAYAPQLRPGGFATATINSGTLVAPILPESAILSDDEGSFVFVVGEDNKVVRRAIKTGFVGAAGVVVESGLTGTEKVVLRAGGFLNEGETINPSLQKAAGDK